VRRLALLLLAPLAFALPAPASADPVCASVEVHAVTTTTAGECVPYDNLVACQTRNVSNVLYVELCLPRK